MNTRKLKTENSEISSEIAQQYIIQMLDELSLMAQASGLREMASLLRATSSASRVDIHSEIQA